MVTNSAQSQTITCWSSPRCSVLGPCCRSNWTSAHVAYFSAFACAHWIVPAKNDEDGRERKCTKGPARIFVYLLHILGFYGNDDIEQVLWQVFALPVLSCPATTQWHSQEPQQQQLLQGISSYKCALLILRSLFTYCLKTCKRLALLSPLLSLFLLGFLPDSGMTLVLFLATPSCLLFPPGFPWLRLASFVAIYWLVFPLCVTFEMLLQCLIWMQRQIIESFSECVLYAYIYSRAIQQPHSGNILFKKHIQQ